MSDYYNLYNYCKRVTENNNIHKLQQKIKFETKEKKLLFKTIINNAPEKIKTRAQEVYDYSILYDEEYNKLKIDLMETLTYHFKPFKIHYKKKNKCDRSFLEILKDESNYILIIDWKEIPQNDIYKNINEFPSNKICDNNDYTVEIKIDTEDQLEENKSDKSDDFEKIF